MPAAADDEPWPSLCDLVEEALLASAEKPKPSNDFWQRERARENIERIKRQVQHLRDTDRCG